MAKPEEVNGFDVDIEQMDLVEMTPGQKPPDTTPLPDKPTQPPGGRLPGQDIPVTPTWITKEKEYAASPEGMREAAEKAKAEKQRKDALARLRTKEGREESKKKFVSVPTLFGPTEQIPKTVVDDPTKMLQYRTDQAKAGLELQLSTVPLISTAVFWDRMGPKMKAVSLATDALVFAPYVKSLATGRAFKSQLRKQADIATSVANNELAKAGISPETVKPVQKAVKDFTEAAVDANKKLQKQATYTGRSIDEQLMNKRIADSAVKKANIAKQQLNSELAKYSDDLGRQIGFDDPLQKQKFEASIKTLPNQIQKTVAGIQDDLALQGVQRSVDIAEEKVIAAKQIGLSGKNEVEALSKAVGKHQNVLTTKTIPTLKNRLKLADSEQAYREINNQIEAAALGNPRNIQRLQVQLRNVLDDLPRNIDDWTEQDYRLYQRFRESEGQLKQSIDAMTTIKEPPSLGGGRGLTPFIDDIPPSMLPESPVPTIPKQQPAPIADVLGRTELINPTVRENIKNQLELAKLQGLITAETAATATEILDQPGEQKDLEQITDPTTIAIVADAVGKTAPTETDDDDQITARQAFQGIYDDLIGEPVEDEFDRDIGVMEREQFALDDTQEQPTPTPRETTPERFAMEDIEEQITPQQERESRPALRAFTPFEEEVDVYRSSPDFTQFEEKPDVFRTEPRIIPEVEPIPEPEIIPEVEFIAEPKIIPEVKPEPTRIGTPEIAPRPTEPLVIPGEEKEPEKETVPVPKVVEKKQEQPRIVEEPEVAPEPTRIEEPEVAPEPIRQEQTIPKKTTPPGVDTPIVPVTPKPKDQPGKQEKIELDPVTQKGQFAKIVGWRQGRFYRYVDMTTGRKFSSRKPMFGEVPTKGIPQNTLRVISRSESRPQPRIVNMGVTAATVTPTGRIKFRPRKKIFRASM